jgi:hypothetical protein
LRREPQKVVNLPTETPFGRHPTLLLMCLALSFPGTAFADNEFGTRYYNVAQEFGGGVNLRVPSVGYWTLTSDEFVLHRQMSQDNFNVSTTGLVQDGLYRSGTNVHLDNCSQSIDAYRYYYEWKATNSSTFVCGLGPVAVVGDEGRAATANTASNGTWVANARSSDGTVQAGLSVNLNWNLAYVMFGSELLVSTAPSRQMSGPPTALERAWLAIRWA